VDGWEHKGKAERPAGEPGFKTKRRGVLSPLKKNRGRQRRTVTGGGSQNNRGWGWLKKTVARTNCRDERDTGQGYGKTVKNRDNPVIYVPGGEKVVLALTVQAPGKTGWKSARGPEEPGV